MQRKLFAFCLLLKIILSQKQYIVETLCSANTNNVATITITFTLNSISYIHEESLVACELFHIFTPKGFEFLNLQNKTCTKERKVPISCKHAEELKFEIIECSMNIYCKTVNKNIL